MVSEPAALMDMQTWMGGDITDWAEYHDYDVIYPRQREWSACANVLLQEDLMDEVVAVETHIMHGNIQTKTRYQIEHVEMLHTYPLLLALIGVYIKCSKLRRVSHKHLLFQLTMGVLNRGFILKFGIGI